MPLELDLPPAPNALRPDELASPADYRLPPCAAHLTAEQVERLGRELDAIRQRHLDDRGETDRRYIEAIVRLQKALEIGGRGLLFASVLPPAFVGGAAALGLSKILDNMEIGHNVMHGQYDWMEDPRLHSSVYEWDIVAPSSQWKHGHNVVHHTYTNVVGKDRDVGYALLRVSELQPWSLRDLGNPLYMFVLSLMFQYGVALHELEVERLTSGDKPMDDAKPILAAIRAKAGAQARKDYVLFPLLAGPFAPIVAAGNLTANVVRNIWAFTVIFCGHFPEGVEMFTEEDIEGETRARWYLRQMLGSANLTGGPVFHLLTGNLSHQIEHHLFPDLPAWRYAAIAADVRELCDRYGLPYNTGPLHRQFGTVVKRVVRLSFPNEFPGRAKRFAQRVTSRTSRTIDALAEVGAQARVEREGADLAA